MCQHSLVGKSFWRLSTFDITSFYKQKVFVIFQKKLSQPYFAMSSCSSWKGLFVDLVFFQVFLPISLHGLFCGLNDGFRS